MPIKINLLAEQQAAEEMRRKDPVKRTIWIGSAMVALFVLWALNLQFHISSARNELAVREARWTEILPKYLSVSNDYVTVGDLDRRLNSLAKYSTNRFLWAKTLNALQDVAVPGVRLVRLDGDQVFTTQNEVLLEETISSQPVTNSWWNFLGKPAPPDLSAEAELRMKRMRAKPEVEPYEEFLKETVLIETNYVKSVLTYRVLQTLSVAKLQLVKPETVTEVVHLKIKAREYGKPDEKRYLDYWRGLLSHPYFSNFLSSTNTRINPSIGQRVDATDLVRGQEPYIEFRVEAAFPEQVRVNE